MKKLTNTIIALLVSFVAQAAAEFTRLPDGAVSNVSVQRVDSTILVSMTVSPSEFPADANRQILLLPAIVSGCDTLWLPSLVLAGRTRYYQQLRHGIRPEGAVLLRTKSRMPYEYKVSVQYEDWMQMSKLMLSARVEGCCGKGVGENMGVLPNEDLHVMDYRDKVIVPELLYVSPTKVIEKVDTVTGSAYIDFPVNQTRIYPDYRRNPEELAKIRAIIDDIRGDSDLTITSLLFTGYASPEGEYSHNERLAEGRTNALIEYVRKLYSFPRDVMHSSWVAEDWAGLRSRLAALQIADREAMLAVVDDTLLTPDRRDSKLRENFPAQYAYLLENVYPALRHSDYSVTYKVRKYYDVKEIEAVLRSSPQKLSLDEIFLYAQSLDRNSPEFRETMEVAVRLFTYDPEANLNAAATAVFIGDYAGARRYLDKAGDHPVAIYTRGVVEALEKNYATAVPLLMEAEALGIEAAASLLRTLSDFDLIP